MIFRLDEDRERNTLRLVPSYLWMDRAYVKVVGLATRSWYGSWGWLWPWMWLHGLGELANPNVTAIAIDADLTLEAITRGDAGTHLSTLGHARFTIDPLPVRAFPIERSCAGPEAGIAELPSPHLPLPDGKGMTRIPANAYVVLNERRSPSWRGGWRLHGRGTATEVQPPRAPAFTDRVTGKASTPASR